MGDVKQMQAEADPDEVAELVKQLADFLFPNAGEGEVIPLTRVMTILQALAVSMGSVIRAYAFTDVVDEKGGRRGVMLDKEKVIEHLLGLARETMGNLSEVEQH